MTKGAQAPPVVAGAQTLVLNSLVGLAEGSWAGVGLSAVASCTQERLICARDRDPH